MLVCGFAAMSFEPGGLSTGKPPLDLDISDRFCGLVVALGEDDFRLGFG